jgi:hypothetical protein
LPDEWAWQVADLGEPEAEFRPGRGQLVASLVAGGLALLLAGTALAGLLALATWGPPGKGGGVGLGVAKLAGVGLFFLAAGVGMLARARHNSGLRVLVFEEGLARVQGGKVETLRWEDVNVVRRGVEVKSAGVTVRTPVYLVLVGRDGRDLTFNEGLARLGELRALAEGHTLPHMLPAAREAIEAGEVVGFGALGVSREGLHSGLDLLAWEDFQGLEVGQALVSVYSRRSRWAFCRADASEVPNAHVLAALAEQLRSGS